MHTGESISCKSQLNAKIKKQKMYSKHHNRDACSHASSWQDTCKILASA